MNDMVRKIIEINKEDLEKRKSEVLVEDLKVEIEKLPKALDFYGAFKDFGVIAEIKLASPSAGEIGKVDDVLEIAKEYSLGGADAISVITEKHFFKGDINFIKQIKEETDLPILQKDFVIDPYQIYESRVKKADGLLLIAKIISVEELTKFVHLCFEVGVEPVVEINDEEDLEKALQSKTRIIAVNARDLDTFEINVEKAGDLLDKIPDQYLKLGFSGVNSKEEVEIYKQSGARGILVGTKLMKSPNKVQFLESLKRE